MCFEAGFNAEVNSGKEKIMPGAILVCQTRRRWSPRIRASGAVQQKGRKSGLFVSYFSERIHATRVLMSSSFTVAFGGIGTGPQTPEPPFLTLSNSLAGAVASPRYL